MGKELVNYEELLAAKAKKAAAVEVPSGSSIGLQAGIITYQGKPVAGNKLDCIVIASTFANLYYPQKWAEGSHSPPTCYAYADSEGELRPDPSSPEPQHETCRGCKWNEFKSAENGKGKKCKNSHHLALIPADTTADNVATAEIAILKMPVTSVNAWSMYVSKLDALFNRSPESMITQIGTVPDKKSQFKVTVDNVGQVDNSLLEGIWAREQEALTMMRRSYEPQEPTETKPSKY